MKSSFQFHPCPAVSDDQCSKKQKQGKRKCDQCKKLCRHDTGKISITGTMPHKIIKICHII